MLLDGTDCKVEGYPDGNRGLTLFDEVTPEMSIYRGHLRPVLRDAPDDLDDAIRTVNATPATARDLHLEWWQRAQVPARDRRRSGRYQRADPGTAAILLLHGLGRQFLRGHSPRGKDAPRFYTEIKTKTARWFDDSPVTQGRT